MVPDVLIMSQTIWEGLSEQEKKWLQQAVDESVTEQRKLWAESEKKSLDEVEKAGVTIIYPDKAPFAERVKHVSDMYKDTPAVYDLIKRIESASE